MNDFLLPFRPNCQYCIRRLGNAVQQGEGAKTITLCRRNLTNSSNAKGGKKNILILQHTIRAQGCLKNLHVGTQKVERPLLRVILGPQIVLCTQQMRHMGGFSRFMGSVGRFLRVRYLIFTGAIGGGLAVNQVSENRIGNIFSYDKILFEYTMYLYYHNHVSHFALFSFCIYSVYCALNLTKTKKS
jgi:hypothetical protein